MKRIWALIVAVLVVASAAFGTGLVVTWENDMFYHKDNNYTQGLELYLLNVEKNKAGDLEKSAWGWRNRMYTPKDISIAANQPNDRPWAGVTTVFHEWTSKKGANYIMTGWEAGILGPESCADWMQTTVHGWTGNRKPMGWSNQVPNEISAQFYRTYYDSLVNIGTPGKLMADLEMPYGFVGGTTFDHVFAGLSVRAGWNIPPAHYSGSIEPKAILPKPFFYLLADGSGKYVLHNATLGHSFFRGHNDTEWDRSLVPVVGEYHYGACVGYKNFAITYMNEVRSYEFKKQLEQFKCGMLRVEFTTLF